MTGSQLLVGRRTELVKIAWPYRWELNPRNPCGFSTFSNVVRRLDSVKTPCQFPSRLTGDARISGLVRPLTCRTPHTATLGKGAKIGILGMLGVTWWSPSGLLL